MSELDNRGFIKAAAPACLKEIRKEEAMELKRTRRGDINVDPVLLSLLSLWALFMVVTLLSMLLLPSATPNREVDFREYEALKKKVGDDPVVKARIAEMMLDDRLMESEAKEIEKMLETREVDEKRRAFKNWSEN